MAEFFVSIHPSLLTDDYPVVNPLLFKGDHLVDVALLCGVKPHRDPLPMIVIGPHRMASNEAVLPEHPLTREMVIAFIKRASNVPDLVELMLRYGGTHVIKTRTPTDTLITLSGDLIGLPKIKAVVSGLGYRDKLYFVSPLELGVDPSVNDCKTLIDSLDGRRRDTSQ